MRPLQAALLIPLAAGLASDPFTETWAALTAVQWPPVPATVYHKKQLASVCLCRAACVADPHCQALKARRLKTGGAACSLASRRRGAATPVKPSPDEEDGWFERAGPATPELICWPEEGHGDGDGEGDGCRPPTDCAELRHAGVISSGTFTISVSQRPVFCDMETDGGGWTLLQRRGAEPNTSFAKSLEEYEAGFGEPAGEHWLGLATAARITDLGPQQLRVEGWTDGSLWFAVYGPISLNVTDTYRLKAPWLHGNTTAILVPAAGAVFQTSRDATSRSWQRSQSGWWGATAYLGTNLNGVFRSGEMVSRWMTVEGAQFYPTRTEMKLKNMD